jgi:hypothetical protein
MTKNMIKIKLFISLLLRVYYTIKKAPNVSFNNIDVNYIIWVPDFFTFKFFLSDNFQKAWFTYYHLIKSGNTASIYFKMGVGKFYRKKIIFFGSETYNVFKFSNYVNSLIFISENLEKQNNEVFPNKLEVKLWENKGYMHECFNTLEIRTPNSEIVNLNGSIINLKNFIFPYLLKEEHSCSSNGVHKITKWEDIEFLESKTELTKNNKRVIVQKLLNIRRDLRVIIVGTEIVLHYWRINPSEEWKPTTTGLGSNVDFDNFPEKWRSWIFDQFYKLNIRTGAFDIAWEDDDTNKEPFILEVSPFYQPNPRPHNNYDLINYGKWKKSVRFSNSYQESMIDIIYKIQYHFVKQLIN